MAKRCPPGTKLVPAYCRSTSRKVRNAEINAVEEELKKLEMQVHRIKATFGKVAKGQQHTAADLTIKSLIDACHATPLFVAFAVKSWDRKDIRQAYPDVNKRYASIAKQWKEKFGGVSFSSAKAAKYAVFSLVRSS